MCLCVCVYVLQKIQIIQTDIMYDSGYALNYAIDTGQIEGAFVQGLGMYFTEVSW